MIASTSVNNGTRSSTPGRLNARRSMWSHTNIFSHGPSPSATTTRSATEPSIHPKSATYQRNPSARHRDNADLIKTTLLARYGPGMGSAAAPRKPARARSANNLEALSSSPDHKRGIEDIMEEIMRLKRQMQTVNNENSALKTKLRKLEADLSRKDKELEDLLDSGGSSGYAGTKETAKGVQQRLLMQSLKQKVVRLEQSMRAKDSALSAMRSDLKTTRLEELRIQSETMYHEILRLRHHKETSTDPGTELQNRMKSMQDTILRLNEANQKLLEENKKMHGKLNGSTAGGSHGGGGGAREDADVSGQDAYNGMKRSQLIAAIRHLEKQLANRDHEYLKNAHNGKQEDNTRISELETENKRLSEMVQKLHKEQQSLEDDLEKKQDQITKLKLENGQLRNEIDEMQTYYEYELAKWTSPADATPNGAAKGHETPPKKEQIRYDPAKVDKFRKNKAAKTIQHHWRRYQNEKEDALDTVQSSIRGHANRRANLQGQKRNRAENSSVDSAFSSPKRSVRENGVSRPSHEEDDASLIGAAVRGHLTRKQYNSKPVKDDPEDNEDAGIYTSPKPGNGYTSAEPHPAPAEESNHGKHMANGLYGSDIDDAIFYR